METNILILTTEITKEIDKYQERIAHFEDLTSIQKGELEKSIHQDTQSKRISYSFNTNEYGDRLYPLSFSRFSFTFSDAWVKDLGIIKDVSPHGKFPISLQIGSNISIRYEPRNLIKISQYENNKINNSEYFHLKKGQEFSIYGKVNYCNVYRHQKSWQYTFEVEGIEDNKIDNVNLNKAIIYGIIGAIVGGCVGIVVAFVVTGIFAILYSWLSGNKEAYWTYIIFFGIIIVSAKLGYDNWFKQIRKG